MTAPAHAYEFPPYRGITLKIIGDITGNYSNNVTYASNDENKVEDFRTMLNLGLNFQYKGKRRSMGFSGLVKRQIDRVSSNIRNPSENLRLNYKEELTKYDSISLYNDYTHTQEPGRAIGAFDLEKCREYYQNSTGYDAAEIESTCNDFNEEFGRFKGRFDSYKNLFSFSYIRAIGKTSTLKTNYHYNQHWSDEVGTNNSDSNIIGFTGNYKHSEATNFSLSYKYQLSSFDRGDDITRQSINAGIGQSLTKNISLNVSAGQDIVSSGKDSLSLGTTLRSIFDEKTSGSLSYSQGVEINTNTDDTFENWRASGSLIRILLEDLRSSFSAFYGKGDYSSTSVTDTFLGASVNLTYVFWQSKRGSIMQGSLGYSYSDLTSSDKAREYARNLINTGLQVVF